MLLGIRRADTGRRRGCQGHQGDLGQHAKGRGLDDSLQGEQDEAGQLAGAVSGAHREHSSLFIANAC